MHHLLVPILVCAVVFQGLQIRLLLRKNNQLENKNELLRLRNEQLLHMIFVHLEIYNAVNPAVITVANLGG